jgi:hypothetical protein
MHTTVQNQQAFMPVKNQFIGLWGIIEVASMPHSTFCCLPKVGKEFDYFTR